MKFKLVFFVFSLIQTTIALAQYSRMEILDTVNNIRFNIYQKDFVQLKEQGTTAFKQFKIREISSYGFIYSKSKKEYDTIMFDKIKSVRLKPKGGFGKTFGILAGTSLIINAIIMINQSRDWGEDGSSGPLPNLFFAPLTIIAIPLVAAIIFTPGVFPKEEVYFSRKYKYKLIKRR